MAGEKSMGDAGEALSLCIKPFRSKVTGRNC